MHTIQSMLPGILICCLTKYIQPPIKRRLFYVMERNTFRNFFFFYTIKKRRHQERNDYDSNKLFRPHKTNQKFEYWMSAHFIHVADHRFSCDSKRLFILNTACYCLYQRRCFRLLGHSWSRFIFDDQCLVFMWTKLPAQKSDFHCFPNFFLGRPLKYRLFYFYAFHSAPKSFCCPERLVSIDIKRLLSAVFLYILVYYQLHLYVSFISAAKQTSAFLYRNADEKSTAVFCFCSHLRLIFQRYGWRYFLLFVHLFADWLYPSFQ